MIRLKKDKKPSPSEVQEVPGSAGTTPPPSATAEAKNDQSTAAAAGADEKQQVKLFGIGGRATQQDTNKTIGKKRTPGEIRVQKDIADLNTGKIATVTFPNPNDLTNFRVSVSPESGIWQGATYEFSFEIPSGYPHEPPKVLCLTKIYHPNIDLEGKVCLNILREDWKPVLDVNAVIYGVIYLFYEPNPDDPLNREAADLYRSDLQQFTRVVKRTLQGYAHAGESFPRLI
jgi:ubiquitin-conjugating enzyme E2 M